MTASLCETMFGAGSLVTVPETPAERDASEMLSAMLNFELALGGTPFPTLKGARLADTLSRRR